MVKYINKQNNKNSMKRLNIFLIMLTLLTIPLISANLGTFKQGDCVDVKTILNTTSVTLSTLNYPNGTIAVSEQDMTNVAGLTWNYTYCETDTLGTYNYDYYDADNNVYVNSFEISPSGATQTTAQGIGSISFILLLFGLMIIFGFIGWKLLNNDLFWAGGVLFIGMALLILIYNVWLVYEFKLNYTGSSPDALIPQVLFIIFLTVLTCGLMTAFVLLVTKWKVVKDKFKNAIKPEEEDKDDLI